MPESTDLLICEALCEVIHGEFPSITPRRVHLPDWSKSADLKSLRVEINPGSQPGELEESDNDSIRVEWPIMVSCAVSISRASTANLDAILDQIDEIRQLVQRQRLTLDNDATVYCQSFVYATRLDPSLLSMQVIDGAPIYTGTFLSVLEFPFREVT